MVLANLPGPIILALPASVTTRPNLFAVITRSQHRCLRLVPAVLFLLANYVSPSDASDPSVTDSLEMLRERVELGEYQFAFDEVSSQIREIRELSGNFDARLAEPYLLLGDAQLGLGEAKDAAESFTLALHVTRMNEGLSSTGQLKALYRIADAMSVLSDYQKANEAQERAYAVMLNQLGAKNPQLLPSMLTLIDWYESNRRFSAAKILYIEAIQIANRTIPTDDVRRVQLARAFAQGMRNTVFPPLDGESRYRAFEIEVPGYEPPPPGSSAPSSYALGQRALGEVVSFVETHAPNDQERIALAKLNLADWHQLFGRESKATRMYREIWSELDSIPAFRDSIFEDPQLLYIRLPEFKSSDDNAQYGIVELLLTVSYRGTVTGRISQVVEPPNTDIEFRTRVAAREARFRPAMKNGKTITTRDFPLSHHYPLPNQRF